MFPISTDKLSFLKIAEYWSREIPASRNELLALLEAAWWLGQISGDSAFTRLELLKNMFRLKRDFPGIVFVTEADPGPQIVELLADGKVEVDLRPRITVEGDTGKWNEASCETAFQILAKSPSFKHYPDISPGLDFIELSRNDFVRWLDTNGIDIPRFWGRPVKNAAPLKKALVSQIEKAIRKVYDLAETGDEKPPNVKELPAKVLRLLKDDGCVASSNQIQRLGDNPEFRDRRRKPGKTLKSEKRSSSN